MGRRRKIRLTVLKPSDFRVNAFDATWRDYVRGEWWIDASGQSAYADQDIGDVGHEVVAINAMVDGDVLFDELIRWYRSRAVLSEGWSRSEANAMAEELESMRDMGTEPADIVLNGYVPESVGAKAVGGKVKWETMKRDARYAYAKYEGAIMVVDLAFAAYRVTETTIRVVQNFIHELAVEEDDEINDPRTELCIDQFEPKKFACMPVMEFLLIRKPSELWKTRRTF